MALIAVEPPTALEPRDTSKENNKAVRSMLPINPSDVDRGQYGGHRDETGVAANSYTETSIASKERDR